MKSENRTYGNSILVVGHMASGKTTSFQKLINHGVCAMDMDIGDDSEVRQYLKSLRHKAFELEPGTEEARAIWDAHNEVFVPVVRTKFRMISAFLPNCITLTHSPEFLLGNDKLASLAHGIRGVIIMDLGYLEFRRRLTDRDPGKWNDAFMKAHYSWFESTVDGLYKLTSRQKLPLIDLNIMLSVALEAKAEGRDQYADGILTNEAYTQVRIRQEIADSAIVQLMKNGETGSAADVNLASRGYPLSALDSSEFHKLLMLGIEKVVRRTGGGPLSLYKASPEILRRLKWMARFEG